MAVITTQNYSRVEGEQPPAPAPQPDAIKKPAPEAIKKPAPEAIKKPAPEAIKKPAPEQPKLAPAPGYKPQPGAILPVNAARKRLLALKKHFRPEGDIASEIDDIINEL